MQDKQRNRNSNTNRVEELLQKKSNGKLSAEEAKELARLTKKGSGKPNSRRHDQVESNSKSFDPGNDFSWWSKIPELVVNSANFKSNYVAGEEIAPVLIPYRVPGIAVVPMYTCYNPGVWATDPVNVWARNLYLKMFQKYRPATSYSASDLGITILAMLEVVKLIAHYERIYGIINRYSVMNTNMPLGEAVALGLSTATLTALQGHLSDFRYDLNYLIRKAQRICIPKDISFIADAISLFGYEYIDHDNPRGQLLLFKSISYGVYSDTDLSTGGSIAFYPTLDADLFDLTADNMCKALDTTLNALLGSDSVQRIVADLFVWFGEEAMLQFLPMPEDYVVIPSYSESILHKFHNMEVAPRCVAGDVELASFAVNGLVTADENIVLNGYYHVYQYNDKICTIGSFKQTGTGTPTAVTALSASGKVLVGNNALYSMEHAHMLDGYDTNPSADFIIEGSLLKSDITYPTVLATHTAALVSSSVAYIPKNVELYNSLGVLISSCYTMGTVQNNAQQEAGKLALWDWAPLSYYLNTSGTFTVISAVYGDLDVIIPLSAPDLTRIQRTSFMSGIQTDVPVKAH